MLYHGNAPSVKKYCIQYFLTEVSVRFAHLNAGDFVPSTPVATKGKRVVCDFVCPL